MKIINSDLVTTYNPAGCPFCDGRGCPTCDENYGGVTEIDYDGHSYDFCDVCQGNGCPECQEEPAGAFGYWIGEDARPRGRHHVDGFS